MQTINANHFVSNIHNVYIFDYVEYFIIGHILQNEINVDSFGSESILIENPRIVRGLRMDDGSKHLTIEHIAYGCIDDNATVKVDTSKLINVSTLPHGGFIPKVQMLVKYATDILKDFNVSDSDINRFIQSLLEESK